MAEDKHLVCSECGTEFVFTAGEQEFYREKGFTHEPKRCRGCRTSKAPTGAARAAGPRRGVPSHAEFAGSVVPSRGGRADRGAPRVEGPFEVTCTHCGALTRLPFRPDGVRPVYCRSCYQDRRRTSVPKG